MSARMSKAALQLGFAARLSMIPPAAADTVTREVTRQHDGSAERARERRREGVRVMTESARADAHAALADLLDPSRVNRAERRARDKAARRAARNTH